MPSCNTYHLTWAPLTLDVGYLFGAAPAKRSRCLTLDEGHLLTAAPPDLERGVAPLCPPAAVQQPLLFDVKCVFLCLLAICFVFCGEVPLFLFSSVAQSCPTLCDPMDCSTPGLPVHHQLPEFTQTHVH